MSELEAKGSQRPRCSRMLLPFVNSILSLESIEAEWKNLRPVSAAEHHEDEDGLEEYEREVQNLAQFLERHLPKTKKKAKKASRQLWSR